MRKEERKKERTAKMFRVKCVRAHAEMPNKYLFVINKNEQQPGAYEKVKQAHDGYTTTGFSPFFSRCADDYLFTYQFVPVDMQETGAYYMCNLRFQHVTKNNKKYVNLLFEDVSKATKTVFFSEQSDDSKMTIT